MGLLDGILKGVAGAAGASATSGLGTSLGLDPQHHGLADAALGMLTSAPGGLGGLQQAFAKQGLGDVVSSWIGTGQNLPVSPAQLESALGSDVVRSLASKAGIDPASAGPALATLLPLLVDKLTPQGAVPHQGGLLEVAAALLGGKR